MSDPLRGGKPVRNNNFTASNAAPERSTTGSSGVAATTSEGAPQPQGNASRELHHINQGQWTTRSSSSFSSGSASGLDTGSSLSTPDSRSGFVGASTPPERIDPGAVAAFLRAFPSMQRLGLAYSELEAMNPFEFKDAEAFEEALDEALGEKEAGRFKQQFDPALSWQASGNSRPANSRRKPPRSCRTRRRSTRLARRPSTFGRVPP